MASPSGNSGSPSKPAASADARSPDSFVRFNKEEAERRRRAVDWKVFELCSILIGDCSNIELDEQKLVREAQTWLQPRHYTDIVEERSTDGRCGWAFCSKALRAGGPAGLRIAYREKRVYEVKNSNLFCGDGCLEKAMLFQASLKDTPPLSRPEVTSLQMMDADSGIDDIISLLSPQSALNRAVREQEEQRAEQQGAAVDDRPPPSFQNTAMGAGGALREPLAVARPGRIKRLPDHLLVKERGNPDVKMEFVDGSDYYEPSYTAPASQTAVKPSSSSNGSGNNGVVKVWVEDQFSDVTPSPIVYTPASPAGTLPPPRPPSSPLKGSAVAVAATSPSSASSPSASAFPASAAAAATGSALLRAGEGLALNDLWLKSPVGECGGAARGKPLRGKAVSWHGGAMGRPEDSASAPRTDAEAAIAPPPEAAAAVAPVSGAEAAEAAAGPTGVRSSVEFTTLDGRVVAYPMEPTAEPPSLLAAGKAVASSSSDEDEDGDEEDEEGVPIEAEGEEDDDFLYDEYEEEEEEEGGVEGSLDARYAELAGLQALQIKMQRSVVRLEDREEKSIFLRVLTTLSDLFFEGGALLDQVQLVEGGVDAYAALAAGAPERQILDAAGQAVKSTIGTYLRRGMTSAEVAVNMKQQLRGRRDPQGQEAIVAYELLKNRLLAGVTYPPSCPPLSSSEWSFVGLLLADAVVRKGRLVDDPMAMLAYDVAATKQFMAVMEQSCKNGKVLEHDLRLLREYFFR